MYKYVVTCAICGAKRSFESIKKRIKYRCKCREKFVVTVTSSGPDGEAAVQVRRVQQLSDAEKAILREKHQKWLKDQNDRRKK